MEHKIQIIDLAPKHLTSLGLTGSEPTLVGDDLTKILQAINTKWPKISLTMFTNAVKLADLDFVHKISQCRFHNLQIDVPLFSQHNNIMSTKTFYKTIAGIYNLAQYNIRIGIRIVIHQLNYTRLDSLAAYIYRNIPFVHQIAFMQIETADLADSNISKLWIDPFDYKDELSKAVNYSSSAVCLLSFITHKDVSLMI